MKKRVHIIIFLFLLTSPHIINNKWNMKNNGPIFWLTQPYKYYSKLACLWFDQFLKAYLYACNSFLKMMKKSQSYANDVISDAYYIQRILWPELFCFQAENIPFLFTGAKFSKKFVSF